MPKVIAMKHTLLLPLLLLSSISAIRAGECPPRVVATTSIVGDIVRVIGGAEIDLTVLLGSGIDPHTFEPSPRDATAVARADILFINGAGLETFIAPLLGANQGTIGVLVNLCRDLPLLDHKEEAEENHHHSEEDPHVWFDPTLVSRWAGTIACALSERAPEHRALFEERAKAYQKELAALDEWLQSEAAKIPASQRRFVTDHDEFSYFAARYKFEITGALLPNVSTASETSARDLAALENRIRDSKTRVLVIGYGVNPSLAQRVAKDTGLRLVVLYTGALSADDGPAATYLDFMRYNARSLFTALSADEP